MIRFMVVGGGISLVLLVWSMFDAYFSPASQIRRFPRGVWFLFVLVPILGPLAWIRYGRPLRERRGRRPRQHGPTAPDDDPDFLRKL